MHKYLVTERSSNRKTGPIPVTTTDSTSCPSACPLKAKGCYAKGGPLGLLWRALDRGESRSKVYSFAGLCAKVRSLPDGTLWRHNQAGDLPGKDNEIDTRQLRALTDANIGKRGFTYTHKPVIGKTPVERRNREAIWDANRRGFTVNLSADNLFEADELAALHIAPVVTLLPAEVTDNCQTPQGRTVVVCPATQRDDVSCASCQLCQRQRRTIVGFPAHGNGKRHVSEIAQG